MIIQAIEYNNEASCLGQQNAILAHSKAIATTFGYIKGANGKCIVVVDKRIVDYIPNPQAIITIDTENNDNYFPKVDID